MPTLPAAKVFPVFSLVAESADMVAPPVTAPIRLNTSSVARILRGVEAFIAPPRWPAPAWSRPRRKFSAWGVTSSSPLRLARAETLAPAEPDPAAMPQAPAASAASTPPSANPARAPRRRTEWVLEGWGFMAGKGVKGPSTASGSRLSDSRLAIASCALGSVLLVAGLPHVLVGAAGVAGAGTGVGRVVVLQLHAELVGHGVVGVPLDLGQGVVDEAVGVAVVGGLEVVQLAGVDTRARRIGCEVAAARGAAGAARDGQIGVVGHVGVHRVGVVELHIRGEGAVVGHLDALLGDLAGLAVGDVVEGRSRVVVGDGHCAGVEVVAGVLRAAGEGRERSEGDDAPHDHDGQGAEKQLARLGLGLGLHVAALLGLGPPPMRGGDRFDGQEIGPFNAPLKCVDKRASQDCADTHFGRAFARAGSGPARAKPRAMRLQATALLVSVLAVPPVAYAVDPERGGRFRGIGCRR